MRYFPGVCPGGSCRYHRFFCRAGGTGSSFRCGIWEHFGSLLHQKQERKTGLDVWVSFLGFFFDLNFAESLRIALKQGYYKKRFLELNFEDPATEERVRRCIAETEQYAYARLRMEELQ